MHHNGSLFGLATHSSIMESNGYIPYIYATTGYVLCRAFHFSFMTKLNSESRPMLVLSFSFSLSTPRMTLTLYLWSRSLNQASLHPLRVYVNGVELQLLFHLNLLPSSSLLSIMKPNTSVLTSQLRCIKSVPVQCSKSILLTKLRSDSFSLPLLLCP